MTGLSIFGLIIASLASFAAFITAANKAIGVVKARWLEDVKSNETLQANTRAIELLTAKMSEVEDKLREVQHALQSRA